MSEQESETKRLKLSEKFAEIPTNYLNYGTHGMVLFDSPTRGKKATLYGVSYDCTTDLLKRSKLLKKMKHDSEYINTTLFWLDKGLSTIEVAKIMVKRYGVKAVCQTTVWRWAKKYRPSLVLPRNRKHKSEWNQNISRGVTAWHGRQGHELKETKSENEACKIIASEEF